MAKAKLVKPDVPPEVVLTLTKEEAETLMVMVGLYCYGNEYLSPRKHTDAIYNALDDIGVQCDGQKYHAKKCEILWDNFKKEGK